MEEKITHLNRGGLSGTLFNYSNPYREVWLNGQKSVRIIVPKMYAKAYGGKDPAAEYNKIYAAEPLCTESYAWWCERMQVSHLILLRYFSYEYKLFRNFKTP